MTTSRMWIHSKFRLYKAELTSKASRLDCANVRLCAPRMEVALDLP